MSALSHPIFFDPAGRRRRWVRKAGFVFATVAGALAAIFVASVLINPWLPRLNLRQIASLPNVNDTRLRAPSLATPREQKARRAQAALRHALARRAPVPAKKPAPKAVAPPDQASAKPLA